MSANSLLETKESNQTGKRVIKFHGHSKQFSNFYPAPIEIDGLSWPTTEHYFQAQKFTAHKAYMEEIRQAQHPSTAKKLGSTRKIRLRSDWERVKDDVMYKALVAKFTQHPKLGQFLKETGDAILIEHTISDKYWADGGDGSGKNMLGLLLMKVRSELESQTPSVEHEDRKVNWDLFRSTNYYFAIKISCS